MTEQIVLLDENLQPIGSAPKLASHHANTPLHLAFSCYAFNSNNELLLTKRADTKKVWPGVWSASFCGHPMPGESMQDAISRRAGFELGLQKLDQITEIIPDYRYKTPPYKGIIENEFCPVFMASLSQQPAPNPDEVGDYRWIKLAELLELIKKSPEDYSYWLKDELKILAKTKQVQHLFKK